MGNQNIVGFTSKSRPDRQYLLLKRRYSLYSEHPSFDKPDDLNVKLWRYLDFTKFVSLIDREALFFVRADKLEDSFEGAPTKPDIKKWNSKLKKRGLPSGSYKSLYEISRKTHLINSWHMNEYESAAMWKLYLKSEEGVAIQTTFNKLTESFKNTDDNIYVGLVRYTDYENEEVADNNMFTPFLHKRKSFEHEKEVRAICSRHKRILGDDERKEPEIRYKKVGKKFVIDQWTNYPNFECFEVGHYVDVDIGILIKKMYISPKAKPWFSDLVKSVVNDKYKMNLNIEESSLSEIPVIS